MKRVTLIFADELHKKRRLRQFKKTFRLKSKSWDSSKKIYKKKKSKYQRRPKQCIYSNQKPIN